MTKQWYYYETIALFTLFDKGLGKVPNVHPDVYQAKNIAYFKVFFISVSTSMGTKKGAFMAKGRHSRGRHRCLAVAPNCLPWIRHCLITYGCLLWRSQIVYIRPCSLNTTTAIYFVTEYSDIAVFVRLRVRMSQCIRTLLGLDQFRN